MTEGRYRFSNRSSGRLNTCHRGLQLLFYVVIKHRDCSILCGHRNEVDQNLAYYQKRSSKRWPNSKHNSLPSMAVDVAPYPVVWPNREKRSETYQKDLGRFYYFGGFVLGVAQYMGLKVRWGGDWDGDGFATDQKFDDLVHFEMLE